MLRTYRTCNSMVGFSKYELNNKLLGGVILFKVILNVTWTQPNPYIYIYIYMYIYCSGVNSEQISDLIIIR